MSAPIVISHPGTGPVGPLVPRDGGIDPALREAFVPSPAFPNAAHSPPITWMSGTSSWVRECSAARTRSSSADGSNVMSASTISIHSGAGSRTSRNFFTTELRVRATFTPDR